jgi:glucosylceramidase
MIPLAFFSLSPVLTAASSAQWFQSCRDCGDKLTEKSPLELSEQSSDSTFQIKINPTTTYQKIFGFGGALTQASASVYRSLPSDLQSKVIEAYYGPTGIGYNIGRMPIHSCDFSEDVYTFDDSWGDASLTYFDESVKYDQNLSLPLIRDALAAAPDLKLYGSPWSPPAWMKDNKDMMHGGHLLDEYRSSWALYFSKWISAYKNQGLSFHAFFIKKT